MDNLKMEKEYLEYLLEKLTITLSQKVTASGFKQVMKRMDIIRNDLDKVNKSIKGTSPRK